VKIQDIALTYTHSRYAFTRHIKAISITTTSQVLIQGIGFLSGLLIVNRLSVHEYGLYTLVNTALGTMVVLSDSGISVGMLSQGGTVWQDRSRLGSVLVTGMQLRRRIGLLIFLLSGPLLFFLLVNHHASWPMALFISLATLLSFSITLTGSLLEIAPKLHQDISKIQSIQIINNLIRLALVCISLLVTPWALSVLIAVLLPQAWSNKQLRKLSQRYADLTQPVDPAVQGKIQKMIHRILPGSIYYCLSGQLTLWIVSFFGITGTVAAVGALGRFSALLAIVGTVFNTVLVPRFARTPDDPKILLSHYARTLLILFITGSGIVLFTHLTSGYLLLALGAPYQGLNTELVLTVTAAAMSLMTGAAFALASARGFTINPLILVPTNIFLTILGLLFINISSLKEILLLSISLVALELIIYIIYTIRKFQIKSKTHDQKKLV
jgi:O-antigen/teichoic acid export membrane protein